MTEYAQVHGDPRELRAFARQFERLIRGLDEGAGHLAAILLELQDSWNDERAEVFREYLSEDLAQLGAGARALEALHRRLEELAAALSRVEELDINTGNARFDAPAPRPAVNRAASMHPTGDTPLRNRAGQTLTLIPLDRIDPGQVDWVETDFQQTFLHRTHHGNPNAFYIAMAKLLPSVLMHLHRGGSMDDFAFDSPQGRCCSVFLGRDPLVLEMMPDGRIGVPDGRHRLYACLLAGVDIPGIDRRKSHNLP